MREQADKATQKARQSFDELTIHKNQLTAQAQQSLDNAMEPFRQKIQAEVQAALKPIAQKNQDTRVAQVRIGSELSSQEQAALVTRESRTKTAQAKFLGTTPATTPSLRLAACGSGGGYRAMICTTGFLLGAQDIGILDAFSYISALSGSTWAVGSWITLGYDLPTLRDHFAQQLATNPVIAGKGVPAPITNERTMQDLVNNLVTKYYFQQPLTSTDIWGATIANNLLQNLTYKLSGQATKVDSGAYPLPIYTAIEPQADGSYTWFDVTPYEVGSTYLNAHVPTWSFGKQFSNGVSIDAAPEQTLGFMFGVFGSAHTVSPQELLDMADPNGLIAKTVQSTIKGFVPAPLGLPAILFDQFFSDALRNQLMAPLFGSLVSTQLKDVPQNLLKQRLLPAEIPNFTAGMASSPISKQSNIILIDAGIHVNLPIAPLLRKERNIDVIFAFDGSASVVDAPSLVDAEEHAQEEKLVLPAIKKNSAFKTVNSRSMSVFAQAGKPTILYMPWIKDSGLTSDAGLATAVKQYPLLSKVFSTQELQDMRNFDIAKCDFCSTFNFMYTKDNVRILSNIMRFNMIVNQDAIKQALLEKSKK